MAKAYAAETQLEWPLLLDRDRHLYAAYGMGQGSWWALLNPVAIAGYVRLLITGTKLGKPGEDVRQMGGDILIDPDGIVRLHHVSSNPHDRPSVRQLLIKVASRTIAA